MLVGGQEYQKHVDLEVSFMFIYLESKLELYQQSSVFISNPQNRNKKVMD